MGARGVSFLSVLSLFSVTFQQPKRSAPRATALAPLAPLVASPALSPYAPGMWRSILPTVLMLLVADHAWGAERLVERTVASRFLKAPRGIQIYLPPSYAQQGERRYPVLYLHDGQNLFSTAGTNIGFGWGNWGLDTTADELWRAHRMQEIILVAVANSPDRYAEYCGRHRESPAGATTAFENYTSFLLQELKPRMDSEYRTRPESTNTGIMGSSLGGICSVILAWEHPEVFGRAASLSGAFQAEDAGFLKTVLRSYQGGPKPVRVYLDSGVVDFTGGDDGQRLTAAVAEEFRRLGWGENLMHYVDAKPLALPDLQKSGLRQDKWREAQTSQHNEFYWRLRAGRPLEFLFAPAL